MFWGNFLFLQDRALVVIAYCFTYSFYSIKVLLAFKSDSPGISHMFLPPVGILTLCTTRAPACEQPRQSCSGWAMLELLSCLSQGR